jgi:coproporphyrinogen III oxidase
VGSELRAQASQLFKTRQSEICAALEELDGKSTFIVDEWTRNAEGPISAGGGISRVMKAGALFEQAGVNFSEVEGTLPLEMTRKLTGLTQEAPFVATGVSLVLHPRSPMVPTVHANFRYLEVADKSWFGGGMDLTPYYLYEEDARHFHSVIKSSCDRHNADYYPRFKKWCDEYFFLPHRGECRGIGGLFYDYLGKDDPAGMDAYSRFSADISAAFIPAYLPIARKRMTESYSEEHRQFQLLRRGRYVEFNLVYDRGTHFGLQTGGRTESILMSLPPLVRWEYDVRLPEDGREAELIRVVKSPREWV